MTWRGVMWKETQWVQNKVEVLTTAGDTDQNFGRESFTQIHNMFAKYDLEEHFCWKKWNSVVSQKWQPWQDLRWRCPIDPWHSWKTSHTLLISSGHLPTFLLFATSSHFEFMLDSYTACFLLLCGHSKSFPCRLWTMRHLSTKTSFACQGSSCPTTNPGCNPTTRLAGTGYFPEWSIIVGWILATVPVALMLATLAEERSVFFCTWQINPISR